MKRLLVLVIIALLATAGAAHANVVCVQEFMLQTAFDPGPADGAWGKKTATALEDFFAQIGETPKGGAGKNNAEALCALFSGPRHDELLELGAYRVYAVSVDPDKIQIAPGRTEFNFAKFDIATKASFDACVFSMNRKNRADGTIDSAKLVAGELTIEDGTLVFGKHQWMTGGMADETYLFDEANLKLTKSGQIVGKTPFFHMFIDAATQAQPPQYPTFSTKFTPNGAFPNGTTEFPAEGMEDGMFVLSCSDGGDGPVYVKTAFDFSGFDIAKDLNIPACNFAINRRDKASGKVETDAMVSGNVAIEKGRLVFGLHHWYSNGMADETYLPKEANLRITKDGQVVGATPYFHMYFDRGQPGEPPMYVTFSKAFTANGDFPSGVSEFDANGANEDGLFKLTCRKPG